MKYPIALQLYSVRRDAAEDLFGVIDKVAKMGYDGVEFAGYHGHSAADIKKVLDANGLKTVGTHTPISALDDENFNATVDLHKTIDTKFVILPWIPEEMRNTVESCVATGAKLAEMTAKLEAVGLRLGFHAHDGDMKPLEGGKSAWYLIAEHTPSSFIMQYDTANGYVGGADPVQPIKDLPGRNASVHLKDWSKAEGAKAVGEGDVDFMKVFEAAENGGGVEVYVIEHEDEVEPPLVSVERCLKNVRAMGK
jgi:sugar phosphate isomerase/epimerase